MVKVFLHGELGEQYGHEHQFKIRTKKEAIKALCGNFAGLKSKILSKAQNGLFYRIVDNDGEICSDVIDYNKKCPKEIHILPSVIGSGPVGLIIAGGGLAYAGTAGFLAGTFLGELAFNIGVSLVLQGIQMLLTPDSDTSTKESPVETQSFLFSNTANAALQGFAIPILYGQMRIGTNVISTNLNSVDISVDA